MVLFSGIMRRREERRAAEAEYQGFAKGFAKGFALGFAEGFALGKAQAREQWQAWNQRRLEAKAEGRPFIEPPPSDLPPENQPNRQ